MKPAEADRRFSRHLALQRHEPMRDRQSNCRSLPTSGQEQTLKSLPALMSHVARKVIQQYSKQRQSRNTVCSQNPNTAAFAMGYGRLRTAYICRGITQGPIFHANLRGRKVVAREASHFYPTLPRGRC